MARERILHFNQILWRICNFIMSGFFSLAAYVQINDPDSGLWMVGYAIPAGLCVLISCWPQVTETLAWRRVADLHVMMAAAFGALLGWSLYKHGVAHIFHQEEGREFSGLMLTVTWLLMCRHSGRGGVGALRLCTAVAITAFPIITWVYYHIHNELRADWPSHCTTAL
ncbi:transmembrane protein 220 isoform X2 [Neoarius graeffei]|uniref:transmembrane protein 220 isoform X2 n=1 Tax=Neoarius graeffei TaxID=443677 RepID=UPI00298C93D5|nr:transmembrane protein 220 isoform X2 [Neoarius graeffei]